MRGFGWMAGLLVMAGLAGAQDTRVVTEPVFPPTCTTLTAQTAMTGAGPATETLDTARIQAALTACGAGKAVELVGAGANAAFISGSLNVPSGVSLIVDGGVTLFASRNREDFQSGTISTSVDECGTQGPNGNGCKNFIQFNNNSTNANSGVYGYGVIDGRGYATTLKGGVDTGISWWQNADSIPSGYSQNNPIIMKLSKSTNFTLYKITFRNSPEFHVGWSGTGFTAWGVKIQAPFTAHNTDGIDPVGSNVTITNSSISDGDDDVAVGASSASSNITISNLNTYSGHGISVGSYTQGGLNNMLVTNVNMAGTAADGNATGIRLKSAMDRGGVLNNITYQNMCLKDMRHILQFTPFYNTNAGSLIPQFTNVTLQNLHFLAPTVNTLQYLVALQGHDASHVSTITLNNVVFDSLTQANTVSTAPSYETFTLAGNVYPAFLQSLPGTGVSYTGSATASPTPAYDCTAASTFPYEVGELYVSTATATNLQTANVAGGSSFTLNAMLQPAMSTQTYNGTVGSYTGAPAMSKPVTFLDGTTVVGTGTLGANGTLASLTLTNVASGPHAYHAQYPGDANYGLMNFGLVTVTVASTAPSGTSTSLVANTLNPIYGNPTTLTATVGTSNFTPTGSVKFLDGTATVATVPLSGTTATTTQYLGGGSHSLTAVYLGDANTVTSTSGAVPVTIAPAAQSVTLSAPDTQILPGASVVFTVTVPAVAVGSTPTGSVTLYDGTDVSLPTLTVATGTLNSAGGVTFNVTPTTLGFHNYYAKYAGDANYQTIRSNNNFQLQVQLATTTTIAVSGTLTYGNLITVTGSVASSPTSTPLPTGPFTVADSAVRLVDLALTNGVGSQQVFISGGAHSLVGSYAGDVNYVASTSAAKVFTVAQAASTIVLTAGSTGIATGGSTVLTARLGMVSGGVSPSGSVSFYDGSTLLGTGVIATQGTPGTATYTATFATAGTHNVTAVFAGDNNYSAVTSAALVVTVTAPTFTLSALPITALRPGGSATSLVTLTPGGGFNGTATLTCSSPVAYVSCSVAPNAVTVSGTTVGTATATISVATSLAANEMAPVGYWLAGLLPLGLLGLMRRGRMRGLLMALAMMVALGAVVGCGSSTKASTPTPPPAGTQLVTITATSGALSGSAQVTVTITN